MYCCSFEMTLRIILDIEVQYRVLTALNVVRLAFDFTLRKRRKNFWWNPLFPLDALIKISHHKRASRAVMMHAPFSELVVQRQGASGSARIDPENVREAL